MNLNDLKKLKVTGGCAMGELMTYEELICVA